MFHTKELYQNIVLETAKYLSDSSNKIMDVNHHHHPICIICKEEIKQKKNDDNKTMIVYLGCKKADEQQQQLLHDNSNKYRHDICCMTCAILYFLFEFNHNIVVKNKKKISSFYHSINNNHSIFSFRHLLTKIRCPVCRTLIIKKEDTLCGCEEHQKERKQQSLDEIKKMIIDLDILSKLGDISKENHVSLKHVKEIFMNELYKS